MTLTKNKYYFEALDNYPYSLTQCLEALNYALSYDPEDADSLCLMGRIYSEILKDYETAKIYFEGAMQSNVSNVNTPKYYISCLLDNEDYEEAEKLIEFALNIKGIDKADILYCKAFLFEKKEDYKMALEQIRQAKRFSYCKNMVDFLNDREIFVKNKMPKRQNKKKEETR
ncbi:tetratricopeptide repeat protein [Chryseobacterium gossypii]|uniref:tetratricopeptide repeat protein n=1 Tax=Chryseobacterium gossypii TaxID=3231602 RepID=UPI0035241EBD